MMATATIASMEMGLLLRDDVFVDFFNTFLNLPVFGQTPIYISSIGQWDLWPELPSHLDPSPPAFLAWLQKHRLPHFCKSSLCLHLVLCQKLLGFIRSGEAAKLLNWQSADQWLLEKCISGSQGMWRFRAFIQGTAGEELTNFWLTTERLLGLDESDARQRDLYLSLLHRLKATHLREGSSVIILCRTIIGSLLKAGHVQPISTRREILCKMQEQVLFTIQSYWLPKFFIHCKMSMEKEKSCQPLLQEYQERLLQGNLQEPSGFSEDLFTMHIKRSQGLSGLYCSRKAKAEIWTLVKEGRDTKEMKMPTFQVQPERQPAGSTKESQLDRNAWGSVPQQPEHPANTAFGDKAGATSPSRPRAEQVLHLEGLHEERICSNLHSSAPLVQLPSLKKSFKTLSFLPWALSADGCAGRPFRDFLKRQGRYVETRLLDLWHELEEFLPVVLDPNKENSFFLRHLIGEKICKTYLEEGTTGPLPLETKTARTLQNYLMYGEFSPCIFRAQKEICKVLCCFYEEFLAADDRTFLQFMSPQSSIPAPEEQGHALGEDERFLLFQRLNESLKLSQALHGTRNLEGLSSEHWQLMATRDLRQGGFIQEEVELLRRADAQKVAPSHRPDVLVLQKLSSDVDSPSKEKEHPGLKSPPLTIEPKKRKKVTVPVRKSSPIPVKKPSTRPRSESVGLAKPSTGSEVSIIDPKTYLLLNSLDEASSSGQNQLLRMHSSEAVGQVHLQPKPNNLPGESPLDSNWLFGHFVKVLHNRAHLQYFRQFLRERNADKPLHFWMAVEKLNTETNPERKSLLINSIIKNYFHGDIPAEELLDCDSSIISDIREAKTVSPFMLMTAQVLVQKAMEKRWFKEYQDLFSPSETHMPNLDLQHRMEKLTSDKLRRAWCAICDLIKSFCKFRREMNNSKSRGEFEDFLRQELGNKEENMPISSRLSSSTMFNFHFHKAHASTPPDKEVVLVRRLMLNNQLVTINFLVDDLRFFLEIDKFSSLADSVEAQAAHNMQTAKQVAFLRKKVAIISKLFLSSDIPPRLRVNISKEERNFIWSLSSKGILTRVLYHRAKLIIFPILMHFWRRFCYWKVMKSFQASAADKGPSSLPTTTVSSKSSDTYSPGNHTVIVFTLQKGIQVLLPNPRKKIDSSEEKEDADKSLEKKLLFKRS